MLCSGDIWTGAAVARIAGFPVIDEVLTAAGIVESRLFADHDVVAVQHVHSSLVPLIDAVCAGGADPGRVTVVAKSYSSRPVAVAALRSRGVRVVDEARMRDPGRSYEVELAEEVARVLDRLRPGGRLLVIDEGAVAARALVSRPDLARGARVVEQTTRGARFADTPEVSFPVVDVARSAAKASLEAPAVARSMVDGLLTVLTGLGLRPDRVGLVGYGRMGVRLAGLLAGSMEVFVHDKDERNADRAALDGWGVCDLDRLLAEVDVLMGCTGTAILTESDLPRLGRPMVLVNGASSDIEFALWPLRRAEMITAGRVTPPDPYRPWDNHYALASTQRHLLIAGGFPINFFGGDEPISAYDFQLTRSLMLAGAAQAVRDAVPGLTPLNNAIQEIISTAYERACPQRIPRS